MRTSVVEEVNETIKAPSVVLHHVLPVMILLHKGWLAMNHTMRQRERERERERDCMIRVR
jgi:hypothetical protein